MGPLIKYRRQIARTLLTFCQHLQWEYELWVHFVQLMSLRGRKGWMKDLAYSHSPHRYTPRYCHLGSQSENGILVVPKNQGQFSITPAIPFSKFYPTAWRLWACDRQLISRVSLNPLSVNFKGSIQVRAMIYVVDFRIIFFSPFHSEAFPCFSSFQWRDVRIFSKFDITCKNKVRMAQDLERWFTIYPVGK